MSPEREPKPPPDLPEIQDAFARAITVPFEFASQGEDVRVQIERYPSRVVDEMRPRPPTGGAERLATYNRQYWYRLFTVLQEEFPLLVRLLGASRFNRLASAYLGRRPSSSPLLQDLPRGLTAFMEESHDWSDERLVAAARLDERRSIAFFAADLTALDAATAAAIGEAFLTTPLQLQPHWFLFEDRFGLVEMRRHLRDVDPTSVPQAGPDRTARWWAIWRDRGTFAELPLDPHEAALLARIEVGVPLGDACAALESSLPPAERTRVEDAIGGWVARWRQLGWMVRPGASD